MTVINDDPAIKISTADATDLPSTIQLSNDIKEGLNDLIIKFNLLLENLRDVQN